MRQAVKELMKGVALWLMLLTGLTWMLFGCAAKKPTSANPNPTTPFQQVVLWNTGLAQSNQDIAQVIQGLQANKTIDVNTARAILTVQFKIAAADKKLTAILQNGQEYTSGHASEVNDLLTEIGDGANDLISNGLVGISDPTKRQAVAASVSSVVGLGKMIVTTLQGIGVLKAQAPAVRSLEWRLA